MNLRQKYKSTTKMTAEKEKQNGCTINSDSKFNCLSKVVLTPLKLTDSNSTKFDTSSNLCNKPKAETTADILNSTRYSDPKLKMACKVRVLRMNFDEGIKSDLQRKGLQTPSPRTDCTRNIMCKVQLRKISRTKKVKVIVKDQNNADKPPESQSSQAIPEKQIKQNENTADEVEPDKFNMICKVHLERIDLSHFTGDERSSNKIISDSNRKHNRKNSTNIKQVNNNVLDQSNLDAEVISNSSEVESHVIDTGQENKAKKQDIELVDEHHKKVSEFHCKISASDKKKLTKESLKSCEAVNTSVVNCECCTTDDCPLHNDVVLVSNKAKDRNTEINSKDQKMKNKFFKHRDKNEEKTKAAPLSGRNQNVAKKHGRNKKTPLNELDVNIPKVVVEKCTDRIPVYKKEVDGLSKIDEEKMDAYEFDFDSEDVENTEKPAKTKKRRKPRAPKKKTTANIYDKRIKEIMNKLAGTINSNKIVAKEIPKTKKDTNGIFPVSTVRIQTKQPRVKFKDVEENENANVNNKETIKNHTDNEKPNDNLNITTKPVPQIARDNVVLPQVRTSNSEDTFCGFNNHSLKLSRIRRNIMNRYLQKQELDTNAASDRLSLSIARDISTTPTCNQSLNNQINHQGTLNDADALRNSSHLVLEKEHSLLRHTSIDLEGELNGQTARPKSTCSVYSDINNEILHHDFNDDDDGGDDSLPSFANQVHTKHANPWRFSPNNSTSRDNSAAAGNVNSKSNDLVTTQAENDSPFIRPESACSAISKATNLYESLNDDDPYFGFDDDDNEDEVVGLSPLSEIDKDMYQNRRKQALLNTTFRKTGSPWRYSPRNISYNPHFVRIKNNGLPVVNQDPVLDYTFDENIKQHYPILNSTERSNVTITKSPKQKSILNYITTSKDITENKENIPRASMFDNEDFSPIKIRDTPKRPEAKKVKRNILGALNDNIIIHSVQVISTPLRSNNNKQIESPNLSAIFDDVKNDHAAFQKNTTLIRTRQRGDETLLKATDEQDITIGPTQGNDNGPNSHENVELQIKSQNKVEDKFHGFACTNIETSKVISHKLNEFLEKQKAIMDKENKRRVETFFGFETVIDDSADMLINNNNDNENKDDSNGAKPYRFSIGKARKEYHKKKKAQEKIDEEARKELPEADKAAEGVSDSEDDFDLPTSVPEDETLKGGLFEEIEVEKPDRTYVPKRRRRRAVSVETEPDEEHDKVKKKRKDQPTKQEIEELEKWASEFNRMCEEVEQFPLEIE